jgi:hypothetical protein
LTNAHPSHDDVVEVVVEVAEEEEADVVEVATLLAPTLLAVP